MKKLIFALAALLAVACGKKQPELFDASAFETKVDGRETSLYTLRNANGMAVQLTNYGARIVALWVPDREGDFRDVVTGFETIGGYLDARDVNNGPIVGRYGNRIAFGAFVLDSVDYQLPLNDGQNHLHGGLGGWGQRVWEAMQEGNSVRMSYLSPDGEQGYPGNLSIEVTYTLTDDNELVINYSATTDAPTVLNPTSHAYFNLHGTNARSTDSHLLTIHAESFTPTDVGLIPTGEIVPVAGTSMDFRTATPIGERIETPDYEPLIFGKGYDHNWILRKRESAAIALAAEAYEPSTGIVMELLTDQPAVQFYSGNFMDGSEPGKRGNKNAYRSAIALEAQHYPDSPNHPHFPSTVLRPGETYTQTSIYRFGVR